MMLPVVLHQATPGNYRWNDDANDVASSYVVYHGSSQGHCSLL